MKLKLSLATIFLFFYVTIQAQSLIDHIKNGETKTAKRLLEQNPDLANETDNYGATAFMWALFYEHLEFAKYLYKSGADPHQKGLIYFDRSSYYGSPLSIAVADGSMESIKFLIEKCGISPNDHEMDNYGQEESWTPLHWLATRSDSVSAIFKYLTSQGAQVNIQDRDGNTPLHIAASNHNTTYIKLLLQHGANPKVSNKDLQTPLSLAWLDFATATLLYEQNPDPEVFKSLSPRLIKDLLLKEEFVYAHWLISQGLPITAPIWGKQTILHDGFMLKNPATTLFLINHGLDVNAKTKKGKTPLHIAAEGSYYGSMDILLNHGADPNALDNNGNPPLWSTAGHQLDYIAMEKLLDTGADINYHRRGNSLFTKVAKYGHPYDLQYIFDKGASADLHNDETNGDLLEYLLLMDDTITINTIGAHGFDLTNASDAYEQPLIIGFIEKEWLHDYLEILLKAGADPNVRNEYGETALIVALDKGNEKVSKLLIDHGADVNLPDKYGNTPVIQAGKAGITKEVLKKLIDAGADINHKATDGSTIMSATLKRYDFEGAILTLKSGFDIENDTTSLAFLRGYHWSPRQQKEWRSFLSTLFEDKLKNSSKVQELQQQLLFSAIEKSEYELAKALLETGVRTDLPNTHGDIPTHYLIKTSQNPSPTFFQLLKEHKVDFNKANKNGETALQIAFDRQQAWVLQYLIANGARESQLLSTELPPLYKAILREKKSQLLALLNDDSSTLRNKKSVSFLDWCIILNKQATFKLLLQKGFKPENVRPELLLEDTKWLKVLNENGLEYTAPNSLIFQTFMFAVYLDKPDVIDLLVANGLQLATSSQKLAEAVYLSIGQNNGEMLTKLLDMGLSASIPLKGYENALDYALYSQKDHLAYQLFATNKKMPVKRKNRFMHAILDHTPEKANEVFETLQDSLNITYMDDNDTSLFCKAAHHNDTTFLKTLIRQGLAPTSSCHKNTSVMKTAIKLSNPTLVELLLKNAKLESLDPDDKLDWLFETVKNNDSQVMTQLLLNGLSINMQGKFDLSPNLLSHGLVAKCKLSYFKNLSAYGFDFITPTNMTFIRDAIRNDRLDVLYYLNDSHDLFSKIDHDNWWSLLCRTAESEHVELVELLLKSEKEYDVMELYEPLNSASANGDREMIALLFEHGASFKQKKYIDDQGPLTKLITEGHEDLLPLFVENGFGINDTTQYGGTLVNHAVEISRYDVLPTLVDLGASLDVENKFGDYHPLATAIKNRSLEQLKVALQEGANVNYVPKYGPILNQATKAGFYNAINLLIRSGAYMRLKDKYGNTALHQAIINQDFIAFELFIKHSDALNLKNNEGFTPLHLACASGNFEVAKTLIEMGVDIDTYSIRGVSPIMSACLTGKKKLVTLLLSKQAALKSNNDHFDVTDYAEASNNPEVLKILQKNSD